MNKNTILWGLGAFLGALFSAGGTILTGIASNKVISDVTAKQQVPTVKLTEPVATPEAPVCPPENN